jgi:DNA replication protein DnaC
LTKTKKLRLLRNSEYDVVAAQIRATGGNIDTCPTCGSVLEHDPDSGFCDRVPGQYRFRGELHDCDCERQILLRQHYTLANIPQQYQRLDWSDYDGSKDARDAVKLFLDKWDSFLANGVGLEFAGHGLGTGKTFAATHIAKELIKRNVRTYFISFLELVTAFAGDEASVEQIKNAPLLVLDEVVPGLMSQAQATFLAEKLEVVIRYRTNWNLVTIMTTNLEEEQLAEKYPRVYSLLEAKQIRVVLKGEDQRMTKVGMENIEIAANGEVRPLT